MFCDCDYVAQLMCDRTGETVNLAILSGSKFGEYDAYGCTAWKLVTTARVRRR